MNGRDKGEMPESVDSIFSAWLDLPYDEIKSQRLLQAPLGKDANKILDGITVEAEHCDRRRREPGSVIAKITEALAQASTPSGKIGESQGKVLQYRLFVIRAMSRMYLPTQSLSLSQRKELVLNSVSDVLRADLAVGYMTDPARDMVMKSFPSIGRKDLTALFYRKVTGADVTVLYGGDPEDEKVYQSLRAVKPSFVTEIGGIRIRGINPPRA